MRDTLFKNRKYYDNFIASLDKGIERVNKEIEADKDNKEYLEVDYSSLMDKWLRKIYCKYSRGDDKASIARLYPNLVEAHQKWLIANKQLWPDEFTYSSEIVVDTQIQQMAILLSLGVLFDPPEETRKTLFSILDMFEPDCKLIDYLASYFGRGRSVKEPHKWEAPYKKLIDMIDKSNEEIVSQRLMQKYLKIWYNHESRVFLHDTHTPDMMIYVGYWAFDAAALSKMKGLDPEPYKKLPYFPGDIL